MKGKKSILSKLLIVVVCVVATVLVIVYIVPAVIVTIAFIPPLEYQIKNSQGRYPTVRELGNAVWTYNDSEIAIEIITFDGELFGEITTEGKSFSVQGKFLYSNMYLYCNHVDSPEEAVWEYSRHTLVDAHYEYVDKKIVCSNLKTDSSHFDFSKDFTLTKQKNIDKNLFEEWKCEEMNFQLVSYEGIDEYFLVKFPEKNGEFQLRKLYDNYYELVFSWMQNVVYGTLENQDGKIIFNIVRTYLHEDKQYIPHEVKTLTFVIDS